MDIMDLLKIGASAIKNNKDSSTTGLDAGTVVKALMMVLGSSKGANEKGGFDISNIVGSLLQSNGGLKDVVASWVGQGQNKAIAPEQVVDIIGTEKIKEFASMLGLSTDSAKSAIADALPVMVDEATNEDKSLASSMLEQLGGTKGVFDLLGKMLGGNKG